MIRLYYKGTKIKAKDYENKGLTETLPKFMELPSAFSDWINGTYINVTPPTLELIKLNYNDFLNSVFTEEKTSTLSPISDFAGVQQLTDNYRFYIKLNATAETEKGLFFYRLTSGSDIIESDIFCLDVPTASILTDIDDYFIEDSDGYLIEV